LRSANERWVEDVLHSRQNVSLERQYVNSSCAVAVFDNQLGSIKLLDGARRALLQLGGNPGVNQLRAAAGDI